MAKTKISAFVLGLLLFLTGCEASKDGEAHEVYKDYLTDGYLLVDQFKVSDLGAGSYRITAEGKKILKTTKDPEELAQYKQLAALHGGWIGRKVWFADGVYAAEIVCYDDEIVRIRVTSDVAWDDEHPAGSSLKDLFRGTALSVAPFVHSPKNQPVLTRIDKRLNMFTEESLEMLIDGSIQFRYVGSSSTPPERTLTFEFEMKSGRVLTAEATR